MKNLAGDVIIPTYRTKKELEVIKKIREILNKNRIADTAYTFHTSGMENCLVEMVANELDSQRLEIYKDLLKIAEEDPVQEGADLENWLRKTINQFEKQ
jgi:hypothetical protein